MTRSNIQDDELEKRHKLAERYRTSIELNNIQEKLRAIKIVTDLLKGYEDKLVVKEFKLKEVGRKKEGRGGA